MAHLHDAPRKSYPETLLENPSCPEVPAAEPCPTVTSEMTVGEERGRRFLMLIDPEGMWQIGDG